MSFYPLVVTRAVWKKRVALIHKMIRFPLEPKRDASSHQNRYFLIPLGHSGIDKRLIPWIFWAEVTKGTLSKCMNPFGMHIVVVDQCSHPLWCLGGSIPRMHK